MGRNPELTVLRRDGREIPVDIALAAACSWRQAVDHRADPRRQRRENGGPEPCRG